MNVVTTDEVPACKQQVYPLSSDKVLEQSEEQLSSVKDNSISTEFSVPAPSEFAQPACATSISPQPTGLTISVLPKTVWVFAESARS